jgi:alpha-beta hydrolase superfamily lysophospholipase
MMTPVYIAGCYGVLHPAEGRRGVLICGTLGDESLNVYRPLVFLAEQFAAAGSPALRLEYYGAADSGGEDGEPGRFQAWLAGIAAGVRWLRETCGVGPVTLVGVRIGAALAARAACEIDDVEALVLLSPVADGRRFLRELTLRARTIAEIWQLESRIEDGTWFEASGLRLDQPTRDALARLDVAQLPRCPAPRALVLDQRDSPAGAVMGERLRRVGTEVTCEAVDGLDAMLRDPYENAVPHSVFARAVAWHVALAPRAGDANNEAAGNANNEAAGNARNEAYALHARRSPSTLLQSPLLQSPLLQTPLGQSPVLTMEHGTETPICFGPDNRLSGILSSPAQPRSDAPPVLIANTGANPRYGNARIAVTIARWLAANGIASLRMDGSGIGDSAIETGERGQPYSPEADADLIAAIDELSRRFETQVLVLGMCSGAFHALGAAYEDRRIAGLMLVNLQKFVWQPGESLSVVQRITPRTTQFYLRNLVRQHAWHRLLHGRVDVLGISRAWAVRGIRRIVAASDPIFAFVCRHETEVGRIRRKMHDLRQRNLPILFLLSSNDPGLVEIGEYFGANGRQFRRQSNVMFRLLDGADHTLGAHWMRQTLLGLVATFLRQRCGLIIDATDVAPPPAVRVTPSRQDAVVVRSLMPGPMAPAPVAIDTPGSAA